MKTKQFKISDLIPDNKNYNKGNEFGNSLIEKSLRKNGAGRSILLDKNNRIIAGNKTIENAGAIGLEDVQIVESDGKRIIAVKRTDIDLDSRKGREMALADNATAKANIEWDTELLNQDWTTEEQADWGIVPEFEIKEAQEDDYVIPDEIETDIVLGDLFEIGQHRLFCGDSTKTEDVEKLLDGGKPNLMVTDPPYGVNYQPKWRDAVDKKGLLGNRKTVNNNNVTNDERVNWADAYSLFTGNVVYVWHGDRHAGEVQQNLLDCGFETVCQIIWRKPQGIFGRGDYHWQHEPCWYAVRKGAKHSWQNSRKETTVWDIAGMSPFGRSSDVIDKSNGHGTQKPVECMARPIKNNTYERESVYDPFIGSGTTMVAAHQLNRKCYGMEIDSKYCQVIVDRMLKLDPAIEIKKNGKSYKKTGVKQVEHAIS